MYDWGLVRDLGLKSGFESPYLGHGPKDQPTEVGGNNVGAVIPGETLGTLHSFDVGTNKTKQHGINYCGPGARARVRECSK